eukprot:TRINITY_DN7311_c0_g1_i1.p1 TRINITY_DN7311_c0_g1~~TRINITY_DN7311_c0_g1_i1.p1  ORF type:complete len:371 (-),score=38.61 TRINITY_DN7311_c0_g1_i1:569-1681(-)
MESRTFACVRCKRLKRACGGDPCQRCQEAGETCEARQRKRAPRPEDAFQVVFRVNDAKRALTEIVRSQKVPRLLIFADSDLVQNLDNTLSELYETAINQLSHLSLSHKYAIAAARQTRVLLESFRTPTALMRGLLQHIMLRQISHNLIARQIHLEASPLTPRDCTPWALLKRQELEEWPFPAFESHYPEDTQQPAQVVMNALFAAVLGYPSVGSLESEFRNKLVFFITEMIFHEDVEHWARTTSAAVMLNAQPRTALRLVSKNGDVWKLTFDVAGFFFDDCGRVRGFQALASNLEPRDRTGAVLSVTDAMQRFDALSAQVVQYRPTRCWRSCWRSRRFRMTLYNPIHRTMGRLKSRLPVHLMILILTARC